MTEEQYLVQQHAAESAPWGVVVLWALAMVAAWLYLRFALPRVQDEIEQDRALRLNRGRRASDRLEVVGGYQQIDADDEPLEFEFPLERAA